MFFVMACEDCKPEMKTKNMVKFICRVRMVYCAGRSDKPIPRLRVRTLIRSVLCGVFGTISKVGGGNSMDWCSFSIFLANTWYIILFSTMELISKIVPEVGVDSQTHTFIVYQMEFDKTGWSCPWNSDQNCTENSARGW